MEIFRLHTAHVQLARVALRPCPHSAVTVADDSQIYTSVSIYICMYIYVCIYIYIYIYREREREREIDR